MSKKDKIPLAVRNAVWDKYISRIEKIGKCYCCEEIMVYPMFHCGQYISEYNGGKVTIQNLRPICGYCNSSIGRHNMGEFMKKYGFDKEIKLKKRTLMICVI